jgi:hypothetical protein
MSCLLCVAVPNDARPCAGGLPPDIGLVAVSAQLDGGSKTAASDAIYPGRVSISSDACS